MMHLNHKLLALLLSIAYVTAGKSFSLHETKLSGDNDWDYLLFVQRWPASSCVDGHITNGVPCNIPANISSTDWVLHGLWPTKTGSIGPENCNTSATWDVNLVNPILSDLESYWPNFESNTAFDSFWEHEWLKHGTCAQNLPALQGELNFFSLPLQFRKKFNLYQSLLNQNIAPSAAKTFSHNQFVAALQEAFNERIGVYCSYSEDTKMHYVAEIRFCMMKDFSLMECPTSFQPNLSEVSTCPKRASLSYPPISSSSQKADRKRGYSHKSKKHGNRH
jgi:ribonuclease T2